MRYCNYGGCFANLIAGAREPLTARRSRRRSCYFLPQFENVHIFRTLAEKVRIMAALPQFLRPHGQHGAEKNPHQIRDMAPAGGIS
jgi:hypothetical protein